MKQTFFLAISAGALVAVLMAVSGSVPALGIIPWVSLISAGAYFTAGGGLGGITKPMWAGAAGIGLTAIALYAVGVLGGTLLVTIACVGLLAFMIVMSSGVPLFAYVPATFMAASAYVGAGGAIDMTIVYVLVSWIVGLFLAWCIDNLSRLLAGIQTPTEDSAT